MTCVSTSTSPISRSRIWSTFSTRSDDRCAAFLFLAVVEQHEVDALQIGVQPARDLRRGPARALQQMRPLMSGWWSFTSCRHAHDARAVFAFTPIAPNYGVPTEPGSSALWSSASE